MNTWISVRKELPPDGTAVFVKYRGEVIIAALEIYDETASGEDKKGWFCCQDLVWNGEGWEYDSDGGDKLKPSHWFPLLIPPTIK